jgi:Immunity protein Imm5
MTIARRQLIDVAVDRIVQKGLSVARSDTKHDLPFALRRRALLLLDWSGEEEPSRDLGHLRRVNLSIATVTKVLPVWTCAFPNDIAPMRALALAGAVVRGSAARLVATREANTLWSHCDDLSTRANYPLSPVMVGYGAAQTLRGAVSDEFFNCHGEVKEVADIDIDPYEHDPFFVSSMAYADGPSWESGSDALRRLEFWEWWLTCALPNALVGS